MKLTPRKFARLIALGIGAVSLIMAALSAPMASAATQSPSSHEQIAINEGVVESPLISGRFVTGAEAAAVLANAVEGDTSDVAIAQTRVTARTVNGQTVGSQPASASAKVLPHISISPRATVAYAGIMEFKLTANGKPLTGQVEFGTWIESQGDRLLLGGTLDVEDGWLLFVYDFPRSAIGLNIKMTHFILENERFLASSTKPRQYRVVDIPVPQIRPEFFAAFRAKGSMTVKFDIPMIDNTDGFPLRLLVFGKDSMLLEVIAEASNGYATFPYDLSAYQGQLLRWEVHAPSSLVNYGTRINGRSAVSQERPLVYGMPKIDTLARKGKFSLTISNAVPTTVSGIPFRLNISLNGEVHRFWGVQRGKTVTFDYELPQELVNSTATISIDNYASPTHAAQSTSSRNVTIVK